MKTTLRRHLQQTFSEQELRQWFEPLSISANELEKSLRVVFPHQYFEQWFKSSVMDRFEEQVSRLLGKGYCIHYCSGLQGKNGSPLVAQTQPRAESAAFSRSLRPAAHLPFGAQFTFDTFIVNNKNHFPLVSAKEVGGNGNVQFNPFIVCGGSAAGKTHILKAIGNDLCRQMERADIYLGSVEDMATVYAKSFGNDMLAGRRYFQGFKCLLLDDLQRIKDHPQLQDELVELFNHFHEAKRQMVFACAGRLVDYDFLSPKLKSRLEWGLIITLKEPDLDVRVKYIQAVCKSRRIKLSKEQILILAQRFTDLRYLQGLLLKFFAFKKLVHKNILDKEFNQILSHAMGENNQGLDPKRIISLVADSLQLPVKVITGNKRDRKIVFARQVAMYLVRELTGCSYPALGKLFGGKDHSTAMYAVNKIETLQADDQETNILITGLKKKCQALQQE